MSVGEYRIDVSSQCDSEKEFVYRQSINASVGEYRIDVSSHCDSDRESIGSVDEYCIDVNEEAESLIKPVVIKWIHHYSSDQSILLVGEGDFSFSASLGKAFGSASNMIATSLDSIGMAFICTYNLIMYTYSM